jgi:membrane associated rhomboid family serine protease
MRTHDALEYATEMKITAVLTLIGVNVLVYLLQLARPEQLGDLLALWPLQPFEGHVFFRPWQIVTYSFLHDTRNISHLGFNMLGLWMFGAEIERYVGPAQLLVPFIAAAPYGPTLGASGGVFGLLLAYAAMFPHRKVVPLIPPIPMPAWLFATIYAGIELFLGVTGTLSGIAHFAHLGGMVGSALVIMQWRASARKTRKA